MRVPKIISKNNHEYIYVKQNNENTYLYKDMIYGWKETFTKHDLGLIKEEIKPPSTYIKPERVKI